MRKLGMAALAVSLICLAACSGQGGSGRARPPRARDQAAEGTPPAAHRRVVRAKDHPEVTIPEACEVDGLENCRRIGTDVIVGGQPTREALQELARQGYRTVVSARGEGELDWNEKAEVDSLGMTFVQIPMNYPVETIRDEWVEQLDKVMTGAARPMLMHCSSGNRIAGLWAVWLAEKKGVPAEEAMAYGTEAGMTRISPVVGKRLGRAED